MRTKFYHSCHNSYYERVSVQAHSKSKICPQKTSSPASGFDDEPDEARGSLLVTGFDALRL